MTLEQALTAVDYGTIVYSAGQPYRVVGFRFNSSKHGVFFKLDRALPNGHTLVIYAAVEL